MNNYNKISQKMKTKHRTFHEFAIDETTANDTIREADLSSAEIIYPQKKSNKKNRNQKNELSNLYFSKYMSW